MFCMCSYGIWEDFSFHASNFDEFKGKFRRVISSKVGTRCFRTGIESNIWGCSAENTVVYSTFATILMGPYIVMRCKVISEE